MASKNVPVKGKKVDSKQLTYMRDRDREKVRGIFVFHEVSGGTMSFVNKKYKGDKLERYDLKDGEEYEIPLGIAKHLNRNCWYPVHEFLLDENGKPKQKVSKKVHRCSFRSLEFTDHEDLNPAPDIVGVENVIAS